MVGGGLARELVERGVEQRLRVLVAPLPATDGREVRDHLPLVFVVTELPKENERFFEVPDCRRDATLGMNESEREVVERQGLGPPVAQFTQDRERRTMLLGRLFVVAVPPKVRSELIEPSRFSVRVDADRFFLTNLEEGTGLVRGVGCAALQTLLDVLLADPALEAAGRSLDRPECSRELFAGSPAAQEHHGASHEQESEGNGQNDADSDSCEHPGQEEPEPAERERAAAQLLPIG